MNTIRIHNDKISHIDNTHISHYNIESHTIFSPVHIPINGQDTVTGYAIIFKGRPADVKRIKLYLCAEPMSEWEFDETAYIKYNRKDFVEQRL